MRRSSPRLPQPAALEPGPLEAAPQVGIAAHDTPHELAAVVLDHGHDRPLIDPEVIRVDPAGRRLLWRARLRVRRAAEARIERLPEAGCRAEGGSEAMVHLECRRQHDLGGEGKRADGRGGSDGTVVDNAIQPHAARRVLEEAALRTVVPLPRGSRPVAGRQAPHVLPVSLPVHGIRDGVAALGVGGPAAVLEVVEVVGAHVGIANAAEVHPYVAVLVTEERGKGEIGLTVKRAPVSAVSPRPPCPGPLADRRGRGAEREEIDDHRLVVALPVVTGEALLRGPGERDPRRARLGPGPVHATVDLVRQFSDLELLRLLRVEIALTEEHAPKEQRGVDGRDFAVVGARTGAHVDEVMEESVLVGFVREEAQRRQHALARRRARDIAALDADRVGGEPEADRRDAGEWRRRIAVRNETVVRIPGLPEEAEGALLEIGDDRIERLRLRPGRADRIWLGSRLRVGLYWTAAGRRRGGQPRAARHHGPKSDPCRPGARAARRAPQAPAHARRRRRRTRRSEFAPHEARTTSSTGRVSTVPVSVRGWSIAAASLSSARRPIAATSTRTVVSGGWTKRATGTSSQPASAISSA